MAKYRVRFSEGALERVEVIEAETPEQAVGMLTEGAKLQHISLAKRGRPPKQSLVPPDLA